MAISEEKIKEFFNDEEKINKLASDEEFVNRVSEGTSTCETYVETFKKLGLEMSADEAKVLQEIVAKIMDKPVEELDDSSLKDIVGGVAASDVAAGIGIGVMGAVSAAMLTGTGCLIASYVYYAKSRKARNRGNMSDYYKYSKKSRCCSQIGSDIASLGFTAAVRRYAES